MSIFVGIDLGTTNSAICTFDGEKVRTWKSPEQNDVTPSVIYNDGRRKYVGKRAYDLMPSAEDSTARLFKRLMGTSTPIRIKGSAQPMTPEACSAEVLKTLFGYLPEEVRSSVVGTVITVPAAFNQMQKDATLQAAEHAGIGSVAIIQEPVAAVMSVMRSRSSDGIFIVYDLGGGTLDVAIADAASGRVSLQAHGGIEMCGGRDWDRAIADNVVRPWLDQNFRLPDSLRTNPDFKRLVALVEWASEKAKIELSAQGSAVVALAESEVRMRDLDGTEMFVEAPLGKSQLDELIQGMINDSIVAVRETMERAHIGPHDVNRIVFVGGPTQYKTVRDTVAFELGIAGALDVNPMTAVAEGAAVFAESIDWASESRGRKAARGAVDAKEAGLSFNYTARTPSSRAKLLVKITKPLSPGAEFQVDSLETGWSSGRMSLADGSSVDLTLTKAGDNAFQLSAFTADGSAIRLPQDRIVISRTAATIDAIPASHSVGLEVLDKLGGRPELLYLVRAGDSLPKKGHVTVHAGSSIRAGGSGALLFKLWQGEIESPVEDNLFIGEVRITGDDIESGVIPQGATIDCEYAISDAGTFTIEVSVKEAGVSVGSGHNFYSPQEGQINFEDATQRIDLEVERLGSRLEDLSAQIEDEGLNEAAAKLDEAKDLSQEGADAEHSKKAMDRVHEVKRLLATVTKRNLAQTRRVDHKSVTDFFNEFCREEAKPSETSQFDNASRTALNVIENKDSSFEAQLDRMRGINFAVIWRQDWYVVARFKRLAETAQLFVDRDEHQLLVAQGLQAIKQDDMDALRRVLITMMSKDTTSGFDGTMAVDANIVRSQ
jgi:molecular chaperone DnaK